MPNDSSLYETDFFLWTEQQAADLRRAAHEGSNVPLDYENLAEEIESLGRSQKREVASLVSNILEHLIKIACSPANDPRPGWAEEVGRFRRDLEDCLEDSPSLVGRLDETIERVWPRAVRLVNRTFELYGETKQTEARLVMLKLKGAPSAAQVRDADFFWPAPPDPL